MVEKEKVLEALNKIRQGKKRNFVQSIELIINLKEVDIKTNKIDEFIELPAGRGKPAKVCALVGPELKDSASKFCAEVVLASDFGKLDSRKIRKLARKCDYFIAQANIMPDVARTFGRFLSPLGKMPNPRAGLVVPPKANLEPLANKLKRTVRLTAKKSPVLQVLVGVESMPDEDLAKNILFVLEQSETKLPQGKSNIKTILLKTSMGGPVQL